MTRSLALSLATASLPILLRLEPERAHRLALRGLKALQRFWPSMEVPANLAVDCAGLRFVHPVGVAAGFDKDGDYLDALGAIGFSHVEVGTVTPRPQPGNPPPRIHRIPAATALVNRMGFNSKGIAHVVQQLQRSTFRGIRGVSIGKNAETAIDKAADDYLACLRAAYSLADYFAINVSSPNTSDLRRLQGGEDLGRLMGTLQDERVRLMSESGKLVPIFVKIAPDLSSEQLSTLAGEFRRLGVDGVIATNTTVALDDVGGVPAAFEGGGLSGAPLHPRSLRVIAQLRSELGADFPIIGVGGIATAEAALATLNAGANVIQLYTGLIYRGPALLQEILRALL
ncbi:MAG TPA: quinone-dependent dihydroorotate dehydrogenase [Steroidobacteraceae bacterium]|nr:quinone-dependent dihydroorotate dehydrogenase [Steroidobacteraceae bacterium]